MVPRRRRSDGMVKVKVNKTISGIVSFIWILDIKQQSNMVLSFYSLTLKTFHLEISFSAVPYFREWSI